MYITVCYSCSGSTRISRCPIPTKYEGLNMENMVLASPLNDIPIITEWYEISYFHQASLAC